MRPSEAAGLARQALAEGNQTLARLITERLLAEFERYPPARLVRALLAEQSADTDAALDDLRAVTSAEPANAEARAAQARVFQRRGDTDRARMAARQAVELIPRDPEVLESALEVLDIDAAALDTSAAVLARVHLNCGWPDLAERHARAAVSEHPDRVDVRLTLAEALWRLGRLPACEAECRVVADQAEECVRAAVMRAHILSERGRTAEGQELLDRIGRIDPEFREARELLGTLEIHRLVLPGEADIALPPELLSRTNGAAPSLDQPPSTEESQVAPRAADIDAAPVVEQADDSSGERHVEVESASVALDDEPLPATAPDHGLDEGGDEPTEPDGPIAPSEPLRLDEGSRKSLAPEAPTPPKDQASTVPADAAAISVTEPGEPATVASFSTFDWARHLIEQANWNEAERVLTDIVNAEGSDVSHVDGLLLEAVAHRELRGSVWKLLGDHYMRTGRPQAAADAYLRAANVSGQTE